MSRASILGRTPAWAAPALAGAIGVVYLIWQPPSADLAAAIYRAGQFSRDGFVLFDPQWYAGYDPLGYSLLLGPLGSLLGVRQLGALSALIAAWLFACLVDGPQGRGSQPRRPPGSGNGWTAGRRPSLASVWFAAGIGLSLGSGRIAFTLGVGLGLGALLGADRGTRTAAGVAGALAAASALASPLTGAFLALAALAGAPDPARRSVRARVGLALAGLLPAGALGLAFPTAGYEPFAASSFWPALVLLAILAAAAPGLRLGVGLYALACIAAFTLATPVGGNVVRLGALFAGPLAALVLGRGSGHRRALALLALPLAYWQLQAPIRDVVVAHGDPSTDAVYYAPLERFLAAVPGGPGRIEVPFTRDHWEAALLAPRVALARGWERQLDIAENGIFYRPRLTAAAYQGWLRATGVGLVALPDARLDYSARQEAALIGGGQGYLRPVARLAHWRVYAVVGAAPLASEPAALTETGPDRFSLRFARAGTSVVRLRYSAYWVAPGGCVRRSPGGFTAVSAARPGRLEVVARLSLAGLVEQGRACVAGPAPARSAHGSAIAFDDAHGAG